jgi:two-component system alkaline phosphatase synthesis response regulator PhoP
MSESKKENTSIHKVMIVDDDQFLLDMYAVKFKAADFEVEAMLDPAVALKKLREGFTCDAIVLDVVMPGIDGLELLKQVHAEHLGGDPALIMLTNQGQQSDIDAAQAIGIDGYIVKADHVPSEVIEEVSAIIKKKKNV